MNPPCGRCSKAVYPTEKVNCLDKFWHRSCFSCEVCKMALSMTTYKGFGKKPYCSMHYPKSSFTMVTDTPENLRLKQQTMLNSQALYKEDFERSRGRGFSVVTDTPEMQRVKKTQDLISNIKYHEEFEKSKVRSDAPPPENRMRGAATADVPPHSRARSSCCHSALWWTEAAVPGAVQLCSSRC
ncbi:LIM and SH3 domain protein 1 isoform X3 [Gadus morhua]|uniref:LIM and SH3 domain protein 1 isoform X3 n=1 Tax=Gadus morhua TaxID=8049 RepID=UPI0011B3A1B8|nr:LIM and SH3 domain protein 1-like isoform X3 [Gadus morhua]XP_056432817.1 LIM and SH3 domain protein 1-like isoform X3 [Gadus chalcogrammus]